ncbi:MAG TPA: helix-turn-helix domain-containing protein [Burkholderiales bacterium]|jgi:TetR/AcrR family transcriptional repressor of nem operon|nr:helix-turn-helix domain-containing protein [Burkholderiales bacterium]
MRYPAVETAAKHERILREASRLFRERGFDGVGVAEIMKAADLTHGAFYAHFPSKEALIAEAGAAAIADTTRHLTVAVQTEDPRQTFIERYLSEEHRDSPGYGCALAAFGGEMSRQTESVRSAFTDQFERMVDTLAAGLDWPAGEDARRATLHLMGTLVGAMVLSRAVNDDRLARDILAAARGASGKPGAVKKKRPARGAK